MEMLVTFTSKDGESCTNLYQMLHSFAGLDGRCHRSRRQPHSDTIQTLFLQIAEMVLKLG